MHGNRDDFTDKTKELMARRTGWRCSNPFCRALTCGAGEAEDTAMNVGVAAHICAAAPGGKRYDSSMTRENRRHISNGIWLCQTCAKLIDSDEQRYTVPLLHEWKTRAERETALELERGRNKTQEPEPTFQERIRKIAASVRRCDSYEAVMECIISLQTEMDALVERMEMLQDKVDLAKRNGDRQWEQIYQTQFGYTMSLFEQLSCESQDIHQQAYHLRRRMEELSQNAPGAAQPVCCVPGGNGAANNINGLPSAERDAAARAEELLQRLLECWQRAGAVEVELDGVFAARHQYELMLLELYEAIID